MSMIIGRKQVILAVLVIALGTAIFLNWRFSGAGFNLASVFNASSTLGNASYVDNQKVSADDVFAKARLTREQDRATAEEQVKNVLASSSATDAQKQTAETTIQAIATNITNEGNIESLITAKGFGDCVAFINNGSVNVVVKPKKGSSITTADAAQIDDIVTQQTKISAANIKIIQAK